VWLPHEDADYHAQATTEDGEMIALSAMRADRIA
jgi:hypothetical protein